MHDIDLIQEALHDAAARLVEERGSSEPFGTYVLGPTDGNAKLARAVELEVFSETFGNGPELLAAEYARYESTSVFFVVLDQRRRVPAGMMRVIVPSPAGFKALDDLSRVWGESADDVLARVDSTWDRGRLWELATLAVSPDYRGEAALGLITQALVQALTMVGQRAGVQRWVTVLDLPVLRMLQWRLGRPFDEFPGLDARPYLGSAASALVWGDAGTWDSRLAELDPIMHDILFRGRGLEPVVSTPDWDEAAALVRDVSARRSVRP